VILWSLAALAGAAGLALAHGFDSPPVPDADAYARWLMIAGVGLFVLSRAVMLVPVTKLGPRLGRWWVDYLLIGAAAAWWVARPENEGFILQAGMAYILVVGAAAVFRAGLGAMADGLPGRTTGYAVRRLVVLAFGLTLLGGLVLTLPICRRAPQKVDAEHSLAWYQLKVDFLDNTFTAAAVLTGTGLTVLDIGYDYNRVGQLIILVLMEIGGLGVLALAAIIGMHVRRLLGWSGVDDDLSPAGLRRLVLFVCILALAVQALGAVGLYRMWDPAADLNFGTAMKEPVLLEPLVSRTPWAAHYDEARLFAAIFHSASAFLDCGLTLTRDGYLVYRNSPGPLLAIMPLMFLGSLGGPVLVELLRRMTRRNDVGLEAVSKDTWFTLGGSVAVLLLGAGALFAIESTRDWQQRFPREKTPGRLIVSGTSPATATATALGDTATQPARAPIEFSAATSQRAQSERLSGMTTRNRIRAALFQAEAARTGGARSARLDENSLSPASHLVLMALMLVGGGVGGAAGGLRIIVVLLLIGVVVRAIRADAPRPRGSDPARAVAIAAAVATAMILLIGATALALIYREAGSFLACLFEAVSAVCNAGLSLGITSELSLPGRIVVILAMLIGRLIPLTILMRGITPAPAVTAKPPLRVITRPSEKSTTVNPEDDAPIPLE